MTERHRVIIADDHALMREGMASFVERNGYEVILQAACYEELQQCMQEHQVDVVITDCRMPGIGATNYAGYHKQRYPAVKLVFLTGVESTILFHQLLALGADALVSKKGPVDSVAIALESVLKGSQYVSPPILEMLKISPRLLSPKEYQVFELIVQGKSNVQIAKMLNKSESTINTHRVKLMRKIEVHTVVDLVHFARKNGLFDS